MTVFEKWAIGQFPAVFVIFILLFTDNLKVSDEDTVTQVKAVFVFHLEDNEKYFVNLKDGAGEVSEERDTLAEVNCC